MLSKKTLSFLIKVGITIFCFYFLYNQLYNRQDDESFSLENILTIISVHWGWLSFIFFMMLVNWLIEALKWRFLIAKIEQVSIFTSLRAIFSGITVSAFTPNRIGEYGGRVFCLEKADRIKGVIITVLGSISQLLTTIFFGLLGFCILPVILQLEKLENYCDNPHMNEVSYILTKIIRYSDSTILCFFLIIISILLFVFFINVSHLTILLNKIPWFSRFSKYNYVFSFYTRKDLIKVFSLSVLRYFVFTAQFFILLRLFEVDIAYYKSISLHSVMLLIISLIPALTITEIAQRGVVATFLFGQLDINCNDVFSATFMLWVINLLIPAIIGTFFVFTLKFFRKP